MPITQDQINRFLNNHNTKEEADRIAEFLQQHPEVLRLHLLSDWKETDGETPLPDGYSTGMLQEIKKELYPAGRSSVPRQIGARAVPWMAAALILLLAGIAIFSYPVHRRPALVVLPAVVAGPVAAPAASPVYRVRTNHGGSNEVIILPDGSTARLSVNSTLRYPEPFGPDKRELYLRGQASFRVAKETGRPFMVNAGPILTTVLGTEFKVTESGTVVTVRLYNGKVKLQPKDGILRGWHEDIILLPGEQMKYRGTRGLVEVSGFDRIRQPVPPATGPKDNNDALVFENKRLPEVMDKLAFRYHTPILYDRRQIGGMYFSGTVLKADSLLSILEVITNMNELIVVQDTKGFIIRKKIP